MTEVNAPMTPSANGHYVSMVAHTAALRRTVRDPHDSSLFSVSRTRRVVGLVDVHDH